MPESGISSVRSLISSFNPAPYVVSKEVGKECVISDSWRPDPPKKIQYKTAINSLG